MLSLARSRYRLTAQLVFLAVNGGGVLLGTVYNANTPDLYPNNAHHKLGWIVTDGMRAGRRRAVVVCYGSYEARIWAGGGCAC